MTRLVSALPVLVLTATCASAQTLQPLPPVNNEIPVQQTVRNVLVDVTVVDKSGKPIHGLTEDQFTILDNGSRQKIAFFEEHHATPAPPTQPAAPQQADNVYTNAGETSNHGPALVLLLDALNTPDADQMNVRMAILNTLRQIPAGTPVAVFTLDERLRMIQGFSSDTTTLIAALDQVAAWAKQSRLTDNPGTDSYFDSAPTMGFNKGKGIVLNKAYAATGLKGTLVAHEQALRIHERADITLSALRGIATYLAPLPGRKNLLWFSGAFPLTTLPLGQTDQFHPDAAQDFTPEMRHLGDLLSQARVAIYPVQATGLATPTMFISNNRASAPLTNSPVLPNQVLNQYRDQASNDVAAHSAMEEIASETGGRAFYGTNDFGAALRDVSQTGGDYYTIAYAPSDHKFDRKYHKIAVKLDVPNLKAIYRRGYYADDPGTSGAASLPQPSRVGALLMHGAPGDNKVLFHVQIVPAPVQSATAKAIVYDVNWKVDEKTVSFSQLADGSRSGKIDLALMAYDQDGKLVGKLDNSASLQLTAAQYQNFLASGLPFQQQIALPQGMVSLRVVVVDHANQNAGATEIPLFIAAPGAAPQAQARSTN
ncbi:MAG: VWA domain-containing protein [Acidobacteriota bacterium]